MMSRFCKGLICLIVTVAGAIESRADIPNLRIRDVAPAAGRFGLLWYVGVVACLIWGGLVFSRRLLRDRQDAPPEPPDGGRSHSDKN